MIYHEYSCEMKKLQRILLEYIDKEDNIEENYQNFVYFITEHNFNENKHKIKTFLYLLSNITKSHYKGPKFHQKVEQILLYFKSIIKDNFSNDEIFKIFKGSMKILLFLVQEKILTIDTSISSKKINDKNFIQFFKPELEGTYDKFDKNFYEKRKIGENDKYICKLIREDSIEEFIIYVNKNE